MAQSDVADISMEEIMDQSDLSDKEDAENLDLSPFEVDWLQLEFAGCQQPLGICALPGCRYKKKWRSLCHDLQCLKQYGVEDVFCLCTKGEFYVYRTQHLLEKYSEAGINVHHFPIEDGQVPVLEDLMKMIEELRVCLMAGKNTIVHCFGGLGRSCVVAACLMMVMDESLNPEEAAKKVKELRGDRAIQSVKQYNLVNEFRDLFNKYRQESKGADSRSVSR